jgi:hypothetical protein
MRNARRTNKVDEKESNISEVDNSSEKKELSVDYTEDDWIRIYWRPLMAYTYMAIIIFDFIIGPVIWSTFQLFGGIVSTQWTPLTLISGGIFHAAMGAVLGISAFTRGQEKVEDIRRRHTRRNNDENSDDSI